MTDFNEEARKLREEFFQKYGDDRILAAALSAAYERGRQDERERCVLIAESHGKNLEDVHDQYECSGIEHASEAIAEAIRKDKP